MGGPVSPRAVDPPALGAYDYFTSPPPSVASRNLLHEGIAGSPAVRQTRVSNRAEPQLFHTVRKPPPPPPKEKKKPPPPPEEEPAASEAGPSEHDIIMGRVDEIIKPWEDPFTFGELSYDTDKLKHNVSEMIGKTVQSSTKRTAALEEANHSMEGHLSEDEAEAEEEQPSTDPELVQAISAKEASAASGELVHEAEEHKAHTSTRIKEVRAEEKKLYKKIDKRMGQLGREAEEKETMIKAEKQKTMTMEQQLAEKDRELAGDRARASTVEEAKKEADKKVAELQQKCRDLQKELDKPPPVPPMTQEEADKLRMDVSNARKAKDKVEEDLILRSEELKASVNEAAALNGKLADMQHKMKNVDAAMNRLKEEHKADMDRLRIEREGLIVEVQSAQKFAHQTQLALEALQKDYDEAREVAAAELYQTQMEVDTLKDRLREVRAELSNVKRSNEAALAEMKSDLEGQIEMIREDRDAAKAQLDALNSQIYDMKSQLQHAEARATEAEARAKDAEARANDADARAKEAEQQAASAAETAKHMRERAEKAEEAAAKAQADMAAAIKAAVEAASAEEAAKAAAAARAAAEALAAAQAALAAAVADKEAAVKAALAAAEAEAEASQRASLSAAQAAAAAQAVAEADAAAAAQAEAVAAAKPIAKEAVDIACQTVAAEATAVAQTAAAEASATAAANSATANVQTAVVANIGDGGGAPQPEISMAAASEAVANAAIESAQAKGIATSRNPSRPFTPNVPGGSADLLAMGLDEAAVAAAAPAATEAVAHATEVVATELQGKGTSEAVSDLAATEAVAVAAIANAEAMNPQSRPKTADEVPTSVVNNGMDELTVAAMKAKQEVEMQELRDKLLKELEALRYQSEKEKRELRDKLDDYVCPICENIEFEAPPPSTGNKDQDALNEAGAARSREARAAEISRKRAEADKIRIRDLRKQRDDLTADLHEAKETLRWTKGELKSAREDLKGMKRQYEQLESEHAASEDEHKAAMKMQAATRGRNDRKEVSRQKTELAVVQTKVAEVDLDDVSGDQMHHAVASASFGEEVLAMEKEYSAVLFKFKDLTIMHELMVEEKDRLLDTVDGLRDSLKEGLVDKTAMEKAKTDALRDYAELLKRFETLEEEHKKLQDGAGDSAAVREEAEKAKKARANFARKLADAEEEIEMLKAQIHDIKHGESSKANAAAAAAKLAAEARVLQKLKKAREDLTAEVESLNTALATARMESLTAAEEVQQKEAEKVAMWAELDVFKSHAEEQSKAQLRAFEDEKKKFDDELKRFEDELAEKTGLLRRETASRRARAMAQAFTKDLMEKMEKQRANQAAGPSTVTEDKPSGDPDPAMMELMKLKMQAAEDGVKVGQMEGQLAKLRSHNEKLTSANETYKSANAGLEEEVARDKQRMTLLLSENEAQQQRLDELKQTVESTTEALETNARAAQKMMNQIQASTKDQVRKAAEQARLQAEGLYQEYMRRATAAEEALATVEKAAESKVKELQRDLKKTRVQLEAAQAAASSGNKRANVISGPILPKEYATLRGELQRLEEAAMGLLDPHQAKNVMSLLQDASSGLDAETSNEVLVEADARRMSELAAVLGTILTSDGSSQAQLAKAPNLLSRGSTPSTTTRQQLLTSRGSTPGQLASRRSSGAGATEAQAREAQLREFSLNDTPAAIRSEGVGSDESQQLHEQRMAASRHSSRVSTPSLLASRHESRVSTPSATQRPDPMPAASRQHRRTPSRGPAQQPGAASDRARQDGPDAPPIHGEVRTTSTDVSKIATEEHQPLSPVKSEAGSAEPEFDVTPWQSTDVSSTPPLQGSSASRQPKTSSRTGRSTHRSGNENNTRTMEAPVPVVSSRTDRSNRGGGNTEAAASKPEALAPDTGQAGDAAGSTFAAATTEVISTSRPPNIIANAEKVSHRGGTEAVASSPTAEAVTSRPPISSSRTGGSSRAENGSSPPASRMSGAATALPLPPPPNSGSRVGGSMALSQRKSREGASPPRERKTVSPPRTASPPRGGATGSSRQTTTSGSMRTAGGDGGDFGGSSDEERLPPLQDDDDPLNLNATSRSSRRPATSGQMMVESVYGGMRESRSRGALFHPHYASSVAPLSRNRETRSKGFLTPLHRAQSVPELARQQPRAGPRGGLAAERIMDLRPPEKYSTEDKGGEALRVPEKKTVRNRWLAHAKPDAEPDIESCTVSPVPGSRPISQPPMSRAARQALSSRAGSPRADGSAARSFWAQDMPALLVTAASPAMSLQSLAEDAQSLAVQALHSRDAADLDALAAKLADMEATLDEERDPTLFAAIKQAGLQLATSSKGKTASLSAPSTHDIVELLSALSSQVTYGVSQKLPPTAEPPPGSGKNSGPGAIGSRFRREIALLRRTMNVREEEQPDAPITPRFSEMATALIQREELLQRKKEVLRTQRARNQADLERVRGQIKSYKGPKDQTYHALKRMEEEHMEAAQRWEYKRECLFQERSQLLEQTMQAFCKIVYKDHTSDHCSLIHGYRQADESTSQSFAPTAVA